MLLYVYILFVVIYINGFEVKGFFFIKFIFEKSITEKGHNFLSLNVAVRMEWVKGSWRSIYMLLSTRNIVFLL